LGVVSALKDTGLKCPVDVDIMDIDDFCWAGLLEHNITAMKVPAYEIGSKAIKILLFKIKKSDKNITINKLTASQLSSQLKMPRQIAWLQELCINQDQDDLK
jgi:DNA-binding LacI/PurR family transcriptional regulator